MSFWQPRECPVADTRHVVTSWATPDQLRSMGHPAPLSWWQRRPFGPRMVAQPMPVFVHSRPYSRGSDAYAPQFGYLAYNPIGAGVASVARMPTISGPSARYQFGAIFFDVQTIPTSFKSGPPLPQGAVEALSQTAHVSGAYGTTG